MHLGKRCVYYRPCIMDFTKGTMILLVLFWMASLAHGSDSEKVEGYYVSKVPVNVVLYSCSRDWQMLI